ncbi:hypothetical protein QE364_003186 [Nocardioides zeae]|uniref:Uncharacterized protein n=1 Tax=Nocardioides zeae TaxID=1457234 RepID=A0ACC6ILT1_9ACTN|nr:hypothetical protein [Nocardioides zeae]MDR6173983.1 hypothetical protein [Nocardioides zeae]MDR6211462.1 hypothetical protein [Nocardioides zeae]
MTPILLQAVVWTVLPLGWARQDRRYQGEAGRERLLALAPGDAWAETVAYRRSWYLVMLLVMAVFATLGGVAAVIAGEPLVAPVALAVALSCAYAARSNHRTATHVLAVLAERGAEVRPTPEERSALRRRRTRQLLVAAGALYAAATATLVVAASWGSTPWTAIGWTLVAAATVALVGAGWARAWRYGDELPATD